MLKKQPLPSYHCECARLPSPAASLGVFSALRPNPSLLPLPGPPWVCNPCQQKPARSLRGRGTSVLQHSPLPHVGAMPGHAFPVHP